MADSASDDDVILVFEERKFVQEINYAIWPGDLKHKQTSQENSQSGGQQSSNEKRKRDENDDNDHVEDLASESLNKRACHNNRYFSSENMRKLQHDKPTTSSSTTEQTNTNVNASTSVESEEFVKRRDYLMTKLLQSRNLPGNMPPPQPPPPTTIVVEDEKEEEEKDTSASSKSSIPLMSINTTRKPTPSLNEFIPIRFNPPLRIEDTYEQVNSSKLPAYPYADIKRAADHLKYLFSDQSPFVLYESNQAQRTFEIIKYKLGLKSKFDGDVVLKRRIERQNLSALKQVYERREEIDSKLAKRDLIAKKSHIIDLCSSDSDESDENKKTKKNEESSEESEESEDERELMRLIERQDRIDLRNKATLSSNDSSSDEVRAQEGNKEKKNRKKRRQSLDRSGRSDRRLKMPPIRKTSEQKSEHKNISKSTETTNGIDELEREYANLRNRKMKLRKKRSKNSSISKLEVDLERKLLNADMRKLRRSIRKQKQKRTNRDNSSSIVSLNGGGGNANYSFSNKSSSKQTSNFNNNNNNNNKSRLSNQKKKKKKKIMMIKKKKKDAKKSQQNSSGANDRFNEKKKSSRTKTARTEVTNSKKRKQFRIITKPTSSNRFFYPKF